MSQLRTEQFETPEPIRVRVNHAAGSVEITAENTAVTTVELRGYPDSDDRTGSLLEQARIEYRNGELVIDVPERLVRMFRRRPTLAISVTLPEGSSAHATLASADLVCHGRLDAVTANTASGDVHLDDVTHDVKVNTASGDVTVERLGGPAALRSGSGDVAVSRADGDMQVQTASGDVLVGVAGASVTARSASGDVAIQVARRGAVEVNSASGDVLVGVAPGVGVWLDISTMSGDTSTDLAVGDQAPSDGCDLQLTARTMSGDVRITRAAAPAPS